MTVVANSNQAFLEREIEALTGYAFCVLPALGFPYTQVGLITSLRDFKTTKFQCMGRICLTCHGANPKFHSCLPIPDHPNY